MNMILKEFLVVLVVIVCETNVKGEETTSLTKILQADSGSDLIEQITSFLNETKAEMTQMKTSISTISAKVTKLQQTQMRCESGSFDDSTLPNFKGHEKRIEFSRSFKSRPSALVS